MLKGKWQETAMQYTLCMLLFFIPFPFIFSSVCVGLVVLIWLLQGNFKETITNFWHRKALWPWIIFFLLHGISYFYSDNKGQSAFDLQTKLSFMVLPLVLGAGTKLDRKAIERIFFFFTISISIIGIFCLVQAVVRCYKAEVFYPRFFFYNEFVEGLDASAVYEAWYAIISLCCLLFVPWQFYYKSKAFKTIQVIFQFVFFVMLSARMLTALFFVFIIPYYLFSSLRNARIKRWQVVSVAGLFIASAFFLATTDNLVKQRFEEAFKNDVDKAWLIDYHNVPQKDMNNLTIRLLMWRIGYENMKEHNLWIWGAGNGDVQDLQNQKMASYGIDVYNPDPAKRSEYYNLNLHNMPLEAYMMLGIPGLILVLFLIFAPIFYVRRIELKHLFFAFQLVGICFLFQEAALQTQAGILYYTFFTVLFFNILYTKSDKLKNEVSNESLIENKNIFKNKY